MFIRNFQLCIGTVQVSVNCRKAVAADLDSQDLRMLVFTPLGV